MRELVLGIETSCDETAAAVVDGDGVVLSSVVASQADLHARYGGVVPGDRLAAAPRARRAGDPRGARGRVDGARRHRAHRRHAGPGPRRRAARRALGREGPRVGGRHPARPGRPSPGPRRDALSRARPARAAVHVPARERRPHAGPVGARPDGLRGARLDARRRGRRGVRQGRPAARARLPGRGGDRPPRARGRPRGVLVPRRARSRPRSVLLGAEDGACSTRCATSPRPSSRRDGRISPRRTSARSSAPSSAGSTPPPKRPGTGRSRSSAASPPTRSSAPRSPTRASSPLSLCTDNAAMIASAARFARSIESPGYLGLDAYASV